MFRAFHLAIVTFQPIAPDWSRASPALRRRWRRGAVGKGGADQRTAGTWRPRRSIRSSGRSCGLARNGVHGHQVACLLADDIPRKLGAVSRAPRWPLQDKSGADGVKPGCQSVARQVRTPARHSLSKTSPGPLTSGGYVTGAACRASRDAKRIQ